MNKTTNNRIVNKNKNILSLISNQMQKQDDNQLEIYFFACTYQLMVFINASDISFIIEE